MRLGSGHMILVLAALALLLVGAGPVMAGTYIPGTTLASPGIVKTSWDPLFVLTFSDAGLSGAGVSGSITLSAIANGDGTYAAFIPSIGTVTVPPENYIGALTLMANPIAPGQAISPSGYFYYDDQLLPSANPLVLNGGLLFSITSGHEVNIYSNGPGSYIYYDNSGFNEPVTVRLTEVPEPGFVLLLGLGLGAAVLASRRFGN